MSFHLIRFLIAPHPLSIDLAPLSGAMQMIVVVSSVKRLLVAEIAFLPSPGLGRALCGTFDMDCLVELESNGFSEVPFMDWFRKDSNLYTLLEQVPSNSALHH